MATADTSAKATPKTAVAPKTKIESYDISRSNETLDLAKDLAKFIKDNKLSTQVQGKEFVNVEGWQYAGARLGIVPIVEHVINVSNEQELKYQAKVTLYDLRHQTTVGAGFAVCSNKESGKKFYQEFAIMSMAQTRATGKAYRNVLAWIIRAAGYEPTPAEEMDYNTGSVNPTTGSGGGNPSALPAASATSAPNTARPVPQITNGPVNAPVMQGVPTEAQHGDAAAPVQYARASQKEEIIRLLNHPTVTRPEKTKMLLNINRLDEERAIQAIAKLRKAIDDRENGRPAVPEGDARELLKSLLTQHGQDLPAADAQRLSAVAYTPVISDGELRDALSEATSLLRDSQPAA